MLLDLESYEAEATRLLPQVVERLEPPRNIIMTAFDVPPTSNGFACPLLNWTLSLKPERVLGKV